jgi:hypothetical protein
LFKSGRRNLAVWLSYQKKKARTLNIALAYAPKSLTALFLANLIIDKNDGAANQVNL